MPPLHPSKAKHWVFTFNGAPGTGELPLAPIDFEAFVRQWPTTYVCYQAEIGTNLTAHYQGYAEFTNRVRLAALKKLGHSASKMHWELRRGTREEAREYCMKEDTKMPELDFFESTEWVSKSGSQGYRLSLPRLWREKAFYCTREDLVFIYTLVNGQTL